jgi:nitroreductase/SAM-dependent methyltransferase
MNQIVPNSGMSDSEGDAFLAMLEQRSSTRHFKDIPVPRPLVERLVRAATMTPTACNRQLWQFVAITDPEIRMAASRLSDAQQSYFHDAPLLIAVFYDTSLELRNPCSTAQISMGMAIAALMFAAKAHGLGAIYLGGIRSPEGIRKVVGAPAYLKNYGVVCVGYPDDNPPAPNRRPVREVLDYDRFVARPKRFHADIRPHLWSLAQIADFRDKLLWYKGLHLDGMTLHVDSDPRFSLKIQYLTCRLGMMISRFDHPRVLDILSFNGDMVLQLMNACGEDVGGYIAYDLTPGIERFIRERFSRVKPPGTLEFAINEGSDSLRIPLPDGQVQVISCYERLEHFEDPRPLLREMRRVLAPGGVALVTVSNRFYPHLYRYRRMRKNNYALGRNWNRGPERKYEPRQIEAAFREAGFRITGSAGIQPVELALAAVVEKLARWLGWRAQADRIADWRSQRFISRSLTRFLSSSIAYELTRD